MITAPSIALTDAFCDISRLRYISAGAGERAVVLLHGWGDTKEIWRATLAALSAHARVFAPDLPGHGGSPLDGAERMQHVAARMATFCNAQKIDQITLVGHSMGGNVALELTLTYPHLVERLALVAPAVLTVVMPPYTRFYLHHRYGWAALCASLLFYRGIDALSRHWRLIAVIKRILPGLRRAAFAAHHDPEGLHRLLKGLFANSFDGRLDQVRVPTLVINGNLDAVVPANLSRRVASAIPGARFILMRGALHHPMDEQPEAFQRVLLEFLA
ncbi:MAG: alpha/beta fold hydrolase [Roseiflexus sp.]|nr:alpha/beta fold hydrolase [Roseiflexus sp.]MCS7288257.1 alpha/beta fold hydrolase [Roseiflexus sp.]MDW8145885.1 alpha/beta fold hydrolase [Roseiflexaceae bacterium]MDW8232082.1 alpha/beta fold hydrolase [Roseiflexaceae bacterium]